MISLKLLKPTRSRPTEHAGNKFCIKHYELRKCDSRLDTKSLILSTSDSRAKEQEFLIIAPSMDFKLCIPNQ